MTNVPAANSEQQPLSNQEEPKRSMSNVDKELISADNNDAGDEHVFNSSNLNLSASSVNSAHLEWHVEMLCGLFLNSDEQELEWLEREVDLRRSLHHDAFSPSVLQTRGDLFKRKIESQGRLVQEETKESEGKAVENKEATQYQQKQQFATNTTEIALQTAQTDSFLTNLLRLRTTMDSTVLSLIPNALRGITSASSELHRNETLEDYRGQRCEKSTKLIQSNITNASEESNNENRAIGSDKYINIDNDHTPDDMKEKPRIVSAILATSAHLVSDGMGGASISIIELGENEQKIVKDANGGMGGHENSRHRIEQLGEAIAAIASPDDSTTTIEVGKNEGKVVEDAKVEMSKRENSKQVKNKQLGEAVAAVAAHNDSPNIIKSRELEQKVGEGAKGEGNGHNNSKQAKNEQLGESDGGYFNNPLLIPSSWRRPEYARLTVSELERRFIQFGTGGPMGGHARGVNRNGKKNGLNGSYQIPSRGDQRSNLFTLLYNECSLSAIANWSMLDCPINCFTNERDRDRWEKCKKDQEKRRATHKGRHEVIIPPLAFHLCGVCGGFGHYEVECELLVEDDGGDDKKRARVEKVGQEEQKKPLKKNKRMHGNSAKEVAVDKEYRDVAISNLSKEIHVQRRQQQLFEDYCRQKEKGEEKQDNADTNRENVSSPVLNKNNRIKKKKGNAKGSAENKKKTENAEEGNVDIAPLMDPALGMMNGRRGEKKEEGFDENQYAGKSSCCKICNSGIETAENIMLVCDGCDELFHCKCLDPPLSSIPDGDWFCDNCISHDSDTSSIVEIEGCGNFVIEQRKRLVAEEVKCYEGVNLGQSKSTPTPQSFVVSPWTTTLSLLPEQDPLVEDVTYLRMHLGRDHGHITKDFFVSELCWAKLFNDQLGRQEWWPGMVTSSETRSLKSRRYTTYSVRYFALDKDAEVHETEILPFLPYYEGIGHKLLIRCDNSDHETFRRAVMLCVSTLGLKSFGQALKIARNGIQMAAVMNDSNQRLLLPSSLKLPVGWESAEIDRVDGVVILAKEFGGEHINSPEKKSPIKFIDDDEKGRTSCHNNYDNGNLTQDSFPGRKMVVQFHVDEILGGVVSWQPRFGDSSENSHTRYGVVVSINTTSEMALVQAMDMQMCSGTLDLFHDNSNNLLVHPTNVGSTIWIPLRHVRFVSCKPSSYNQAEFRRKVKSNMGYELKLHLAQCKREAKNRELYMVELEDPPDEKPPSQDPMPQDDAESKLIKGKEGNNKPWLSCPFCPFQSKYLNALSNHVKACERVRSRANAG